MEPRVGCVLLAAGAATRMGQPKQLLLYRGRTLLRRAAETAVSSGLQPIVAVLGAYADQVTAELADLPVMAITNGDWSRGQGTSIRAGVRALETFPDLQAVILAVADQPHMSTDALTRLVDAYRCIGKPIVASAYGGTVGVPALFDRIFWPQLLELADGEGAKRMIAGAGAEVQTVPFAGGAVDVDTPDDYRRLLEWQGRESSRTGTDVAPSVVTARSPPQTRAIAP